MFMLRLSLLMSSILFFCSCNQEVQMTTTDKTVKAGSSTKFKGNEIDLISGSLEVWDDINKFIEDDFNIMIDDVSVINIVPSIDTAICEEQTHLLGESDKLSNKVDKYVISRDLPMAQDRFAKEANLENITYLSDYKSGSFGEHTGLLMKGSLLLARAVIVTDAQGIVKYMQVTPEVSHLPNMNKAFTVANKLVAN